jgi:hypothetical protein
MKLNKIAKIYEKTFGKGLLGHPVDIFSIVVISSYKQGN